MQAVVERGDWIKLTAARDVGIELIHAHFDGDAYERHMHETYSMGVTEEGSQSFFCRGALQSTKPGTVMVMNPFEAHDGHATDHHGFTYRMLYMEPETMRSVLEDAAERPVALPGASSPTFEDPDLAARILTLHRCLSEGNEPLALSQALMAALVPFALRHGKSLPSLPGAGDEPAAVARVKDYLAAHFDEPVTADLLAGIAGMSRFRLTRAFQRRVGLPLHTYLVHLRLMEARRRLAAGEAPAAVAAAVGFSDQSHLNRRFKGAYGVTPGQYAALRI